KPANWRSLMRSARRRSCSSWSKSICTSLELAIESSNVGSLWILGEQTPAGGPRGWFRKSKLGQCGAVRRTLMSMGSLGKTIPGGIRLAPEGLAKRHRSYARTAGSLVRAPGEPELLSHVRAGHVEMGRHHRSRPNGLFMLRVAYHNGM